MNPKLDVYFQKFLTGSLQHHQGLNSCQKRLEKKKATVRIYISSGLKILLIIKKNNYITIN